MNNDPYYNFCLEEIRFYTEKINEIIKEGLKAVSYTHLTLPTKA